MVPQIFHRLGLERHSRIVDATGEVEDLEFLVGCRGVLQEPGRNLVDVVGRVPSHAAEHSRAELADRGERVQPLQANVDGDAAAHRQAGDGALLATGSAR